MTMTLTNIGAAVIGAAGSSILNAEAAVLKGFV